MKENVILSIVGKQFYKDMPPDEMELVTAGILEYKGNGYTITYQESELTGLEGTTTVLRVEGETITLLRQGSLNTQMIFEEGKRHVALYETPHGSMSMGICTRSMKHSLGASGGDLEIDYAIEINNLVAGHNIFRMNVKHDSIIQE